MDESQALQVLAPAVMVEQRAGALAAVCWHPQQPCPPWGGGQDWRSPHAEMRKAPELVGVGRTRERETRVRARSRDQHPDPRLYFRCRCFCL